VTEIFSLTLEQAHAYEDLFVPALFAQWVKPLLDCAGVVEGQRVVDVACGTGVVARAAARLAGPSGYVSGIDLNPAMIQVAQQVEPTIDWQVGDAANLPYEQSSFDVALCQSALFFFPDAAAAVREMARVVTPLGMVAVQTYAGLDEQPGYGPFIDTVVRHAGPDARTVLGTYWSKGDLDTLRALMEGAGLEVQKTRSILGTVTFPSVDALVYTEIQATPLAQQVSETAYRAIGQDARQALAPYLESSGAVRLPIRARIIGARNPGATGK
jgi:ubiquinone/menaquinone biosynthesis C-methylase UbiE